MALSETTLAERLNSFGYHTGLFGKWHLGAAKTHGPTRQGFDEFFGHRGGFIHNFNHYFLHREGFHDLYEATTEQFHPNEYFPDLMVNRAVDFIERHRNEPFFLYVPFNLPHYPEQADANYHQYYLKHNEPRRSYGKALSAMDHRVGTVVQTIERLGIRDDTIIIFMSDNGHSTEDYQIKVDNHLSGLARGTNYGPRGGSGNTGKWRGSKNSFYEGGIRVPAIISYPKSLPQQITRNQVITAADWFPTIEDLCGLPNSEEELDGRSLVSIATDNSPSHHKVLHWQWFDRWAVREGDWKLINDKGIFLGNLSDENPEQVNYADAKPEIVARLTRLHDDWSRQVSPSPN